MKKTQTFPGPFVMLLLLIGLSVLTGSCRKGPGPGGTGTISGKIFVKDFRTDSTCMCYKLKEEYYSRGDYVYLNYGDEKGVGQYVRTAEDGTYLFEFLLRGRYKVYAVSRDTTSFTSNSKRFAVVREIEITARKENISVEDITILK